jgi:hypothetical protein
LSMNLLMLCPLLTGFLGGAFCMQQHQHELCINGSMHLAVGGAQDVANDCKDIQHSQTRAAPQLGNTRVAAGAVVVKHLAHLYGPFRMPCPGVFASAVPILYWCSDRFAKGDRCAAVSVSSPMVNVRNYVKYLV